MGFFLLAPMPVMLATVNELKNEHPAFVNGIYMMINFGINSFAIMMIGFLGDKYGLLFTFQLSALLSIAAIPVILKMKS